MILDSKDCYLLKSKITLILFDGDANGDTREIL